MPKLPDQNLNIDSPRHTRVPSQRAAGALARGASDLGASIRRASDTLDQATYESLDFADKGHMAEVQHRMGLARQEHELFKKDNLEESEWRGHWQKQVDSVRAFASSRELLPENQLRAEQAFNQWAEGTSFAVEDSVRTQQINRSAMQVKNAWEFEKENGNFDGMRELVPLANVLPEQKEAMYDEINSLEKAADRKVRLFNYTNFPPDEYALRMEELEADTTRS